LSDRVEPALLVPTFARPSVARLYTGRPRFSPDKTPLGAAHRVVHCAAPLERRSAQEGIRSMPYRAWTAPRPQARRDTLPHTVDRWFFWKDEPIFRRAGGRAERCANLQNGSVAASSPRQGGAKPPPPGVTHFSVSPIGGFSEKMSLFFDEQATRPSVARTYRMAP
jgi:hypothetical protein